MTKLKILLAASLIGTFSNLGCVSIVSISQADFQPGSSKAIGSVQRERGFLHLTSPRLSVMDDLSSKCSEGKGQVTGVQATLKKRDFIIFQEYELEAIGYCITAAP
jgi:hypothetical protein